MNADELRADLVRFAHRILELEARGRLLASPADLQTVLGELRRRLFEYEVRFSGTRLPPGTAPGSDDAARVVREAREAEAELLRSLGLAGDEEDGSEEPGNAEGSGNAGGPGEADPSDPDAPDRRDEEDRP